MCVAALHEFMGQSGDSHLQTVRSALALIVERFPDPSIVVSVLQLMLSDSKVRLSHIQG